VVVIVWHGRVQLGVFGGLGKDGGKDESENMVKVRLLKNSNMQLTRNGKEVPTLQTQQTST
jgi:hypothetical protein